DLLAARLATIRVEAGEERRDAARDRREREALLRLHELLLDACRAELVPARSDAAVARPAEVERGAEVDLLAPQVGALQSVVDAARQAVAAGVEDAAVRELALLRDHLGDRAVIGEPLLPAFRERVGLRSAELRRRLGDRTEVVELERQRVLLRLERERP